MSSDTDAISVRDIPVQNAAENCNITAESSQYDDELCKLDSERCRGAEAHSSAHTLHGAMGAWKECSAICCSTCGRLLAWMLVQQEFCSPLNMKEVN